MPLSYPKAPGECGPIVDDGYPVGWAPRYGVVKWPGHGPIDNAENDGRMRTLYLNTVLPGVTGMQPAGRYCGHSMDAYEANSRLAVEGVESAGIIHVIGGGRIATATGAMSGGSLASITMVDHGEDYFTAPQASAYAGTGGLVLNGVKLRPRMTAAKVNLIIETTGGHAVGALFPVQNHIVVRATEVDALGRVTAAVIDSTPTDLVDPTLGTWGNRYYCGGTPEAATAWFLIGFAVDHVEIVEAGTGGPSSVEIYIGAPLTPDVHRIGDEVMYARLGVQAAPRFRGGRVRLKSDAAINMDVQEQPGVHIDFGTEGGFIEGLIIEKTGQVADTHNGWAALSVDGGARQVIDFHIGYVEIANAAFIGAALSAGVTIDELRIKSFGQVDTNITVQTFGPSLSEAAAFYFYRGVPKIGRLIIEQDEAAMGGTAQYHILGLSTGFQAANMESVPPINPGNPLSMTENVTERVAMFGDIELRNVCRKGAVFIHPTISDGSNPCMVSVSGVVTVQYSAVEPMTPGFKTLVHAGTNYNLDWPAIQINGHVSGRDAVLSARKYKFMSANGAAHFEGSSFVGTAPNHFYAGPNTQTYGIEIEDLAHSNGCMAILQNGARGRVTARSRANDGKPFNRTLPLVWAKDSQPLYDVSLDANCTDLHQQGPVYWLDAPAGPWLATARNANYRNAPGGLVVLDTPAAGRLSPFIAGLWTGSGSTSEVGVMLRGALAGVEFSGGDISACAIGIAKASGATFDARCRGIGMNVHGNGTDTQLTAADIPAQLACTGFAP